MELDDLLSGDPWHALLEFLPEGYGDACRQLGALQRMRQVRSPEDLLRLVFAYSICDLSLRQTAAWAEAKDVADVSDVALLKRFRAAGEWLSWLAGEIINRRVSLESPLRHPVKIVDATVVSGPGATGTDWRLHVGMDLAQDRISTIELTGPKGGETLGRHPVQPGEVFLGDRGYAHRSGVAHVLDHGGHVVVRLNWSNFPLLQQDPSTNDTIPVEPLDLARALKTGQTGDWDVAFEHDKKLHPVRLIAYRKADEPTEEDTQELQRRARKKKRKLDARTLEASCFIFLVTDLPGASDDPSDILELYRLRWDIEIRFKHLKSIFGLDQLRARDPDLVRTYIYGKLLAALLIDEIRDRASHEEAFPPLTLVPTQESSSHADETQQKEPAKM